MVPISVIVPALDEAAGIERTLAPLQAGRARGVEVIVADGGSRDATRALAAPLADRVIEAPPGRAAQMNAGAAASTGAILVFLHADTRLPEAGLEAIEAALAGPARAWGRFDVRIEGRGALLGVVAALMNARSRLTGIATGDQAMFVRRDAFAAAGAFPPIPLMEDVALSKRLKRISRARVPAPARHHVGPALGARRRARHHRAHVAPAPRLRAGRRSPPARTPL